jgi:hypothetical protein
MSLEKLSPYNIAYGEAFLNYYEGASSEVDVRNGEAGSLLKRRKSPSLALT